MSDNYKTMSIPELIKEICKWDKKLTKIKTQGGLWVCEFAIKSIRKELDNKIKDPEIVTKMILEAEN